ncbi:hypothetical protein BN874_2430006 [Candidatus Contendobacter odensis Run_B_J11]|uniref:Uncharacterized protein n=1 Tax=Candidatus Contendobacter odensis Run_B_J11 TaxID=1400861 RepID=A0A7U7GC69_9GAMM|nr:hypothetical protein BN874_2430006 [Candidatus Contendobacter odensis Run_B_J11]
MRYVFRRTERPVCESEDAYYDKWWTELRESFDQPCSFRLLSVRERGCPPDSQYHWRGETWSGKATSPGKDVEVGKRHIRGNRRGYRGCDQQVCCRDVHWQLGHAGRRLSFTGRYRQRVAVVDWNPAQQAGR